MRFCDNEGEKRGQSGGNLVARPAGAAPERQRATDGARRAAGQDGPSARKARRAPALGARRAARLQGARGKGKVVAADGRVGGGHTAIRRGGGQAFRSSAGSSMHWGGEPRSPAEAGAEAGKAEWCPTPVLFGCPSQGPARALTDSLCIWQGSCRHGALHRAYGSPRALCGRVSSSGEGSCLTLGSICVATWRLNRMSDKPDYVNSWG